jgi:hypothetical protein
MSLVSEIRIRGRGELLLTGGRGPVGPAGTGLDALWIRLASEWTVAPVFNSSIAGGDVYDYTYGSTTYYRFVPSTYNPSQDAFYDTFVGGLLSGEIANRGYSIV